MTRTKPPLFVGAPEAAARLGVQVATIYAYASRGLIRSRSAQSGRKRLYDVRDLERLQVRRDARRGHAPTAASALMFGHPVLTSSICEVTARGPVYRGELAVDLALRGVGFERTAELLWTGGLPERSERFRRAVSPSGYRRLASLLPRDVSVASLFAAVLPILAARDPHRHGATEEADWQRGARLIRGLTESLTLLGRGAAADEVAKQTSIAGALLAGFGVSPSRRARELVDQALVVIAEHELNASTFAVRVAAGAGADLYACLCAGLATLSGPRHGAMSERVEVLLDELERSDSVPGALHRRADRGEAFPGFAHPLYPAGDPRASVLLSLVDAYPRHRASLVFRLCEAMREARRAEPNVDIGLVAVRRALGLPRGSALALFAIGRCAGWVAHALEQRASGRLLRPRAHFVPLGEKQAQVLDADAIE